MVYLVRFIACIYAFFATFSAFAGEGVFVVEPAQKLWLEASVIKLHGGRPGERITIDAELKDDSGQLWASRGIYYADHKGDLDVSSSASNEGTYLGVDATGLYWSMLPVSNEEKSELGQKKAALPRVPNFRSLNMVNITFTATLGVSEKNQENRTFVTHQKARFMAPGVSRTELSKDGVHGVLFTPKGVGPFPVVVLITGSGGGASERSAALLASQGFASLALAHFNYPGRPDELANIPLEYFRNAIDWMRKTFSQDKVGLVGSSRGGEGVLLISSIYPELISAVVSAVPSDVIWGGCCSIKAVDKPAWTLEGDPLPQINYGFAPGQSFGTIEQERDSWREFYLSRMLAHDNNNPAIIHVENIQAPILLISGGADEIWPSALASERIVERLARNNYKYPVKHLMYTGTGHLVSSDIPITSLASLLVHPLLGSRILLGGIASENAHAMRDSYSEKIRFLKQFVTVRN